MIGYYRTCLNDPSRIRAYQKAIRKAIQPGDTVLEIGCGLGTYSMMAAQAGARQVYAIDPEEVVYAGMELAKMNGYDKSIQFFRNRSEEFEPPERVDWIITEFFGVSAVDLLLTPVLSDAISRCLKPGGQVIPQSIRVYVAPFECEELYQQMIHVPSQRCYGLDFSSTKKMLANRASHQHLHNGRRLATPAECVRFQLPCDTSRTLHSQVDFDCREKGTIHGFGVWFDMDLVAGVQLSTSPDETPLAWGQYYLPLERPIPVAAGHRVHLDLLGQSGEKGGIWWQWEGYRFKGNKGRPAFSFHQNSFRSIPFPPDAASRFAPHDPLHAA